MKLGHYFQKQKLVTRKNDLPAEKSRPFSIIIRLFFLPKFLM